MSAQQVTISDFISAISIPELKTLIEGVEKLNIPGAEKQQKVVEEYFTKVSSGLQELGEAIPAIKEVLAKLVDTLVFASKNVVEINKEKTSFVDFFKKICVCRSS